MYFQNKRSHYNIKHSQNFLKTDKLSYEIVELAGFSKEDIVVEIGAGKGALTKFIYKNCKFLIAVEKDTMLFSQLKKELFYIENIKLFNHDFLNYNLPETIAYKVIGNIPFGLTSEILKKVLETNNKPEDIFFILQKEAAARVLGSDLKSGKENLFSLRFKPYFYSKIIKEFKKEDFTPKPNVETVLLHIKKRQIPSLEKENINLYLDFTTFCFTNWKSNIKGSLNKLFTSKQLSIIQTKYKINLKLKPSEVNYANWLTLFNLFLKYVSKEKRKLVINSFENLKLQQRNLSKINRTRSFHTIIAKY